MRTITITIHVEDEAADEVFGWVESRMFDVESMDGVCNVDMADDTTDPDEEAEIRQNIADMEA